MTANLIYQALKDPESLQFKKPADSLGAYREAWAFYKSTMLAPGSDWSWYLSQNDFYQHTRLIFNPVPNVVDFYVDNIWQNADNHDYPQLVTPISSATNPKFYEACATIDQWTNWRKTQQQIKRFATVTGGCLSENIDDDIRQKITQKTHWRGFVTQLELNDAGDVLSYTLEYKAKDSVLDETYDFKKTVNKNETRYFKNGNPFDYGSGAVVPNPYGFCPAVWYGFTEESESAVSDYHKIGYLNSKACHLYDNIDKEIESGKVLGLDDPQSLQVISGGQKNKDGTIREVDSRLERVILAAKGNVSVSDLSGLLKLAEAFPFFRELLLSFGNDYPELEYRQILKEKGELSGKALERLLIPAQNKLDRAAANLDEQLIKQRQMQVAMAGWRCRNGWRNLTDKQKAFLPFGLDSYAKGDLDFNLKPSRLIELSEDELIDLQSKKLDNANKAQGIYPLKERIKLTGISDEKEIDRFFNELSTEAGLQANENGLNDGQI